MPSEPRILRTPGRPGLNLLDWGGEGTPVLLLHGMAGNAHWWDKVAPRLDGLRAVALDFRGHGDSDWLEDGNYDPRGFEEDVLAAARFLGWSRFMLVGHSMGARVAIEYSRRYGVDRLIAVDFLSEFYEAKSHGFKRVLGMRQPVYADRETMLERFRLEPPGTSLSQEELKALAAHCVKPVEGGWTWKFDWRAFLKRYEPVWPTLPNVGAYTLIVRGGKSAVMSRSDFDRVVREMPSALGTEISGAHHHVPLDEPGGLAGAIRSFAAAPVV